MLLYLRAALRARASKKRTAQSELDRAKVLQYCTKMLNPREAEQFVDVLRQQYPDIMKAELDAGSAKGRRRNTCPQMLPCALPTVALAITYRKSFRGAPIRRRVIKRAEEEERERNQQHAKQVAQTLSLIGFAAGARRCRHSLMPDIDRAVLGTYQKAKARASFPT